MLLTEEHAFRFFLLGVVIVRAVVGLYCMRSAGAAATIFRRRGEGIPLSIALGLLYLGYCLGIVAYLIEPQWMAWSKVALPAAVRWAGAGILLVGASLIAWGLISLGKNFAFAVAPKTENKLVTTGAYRWMRHPLYTSFLIEVVGVSLLMANWYVATMAGLMWALLVFRTRQEEQQLIERFGDEYRDYMAKTGRFFPRPWR